MSTHKKILVIEDEHQLQEVYKDKLTSEGFQVIQAFTGAQGFDMVKDKPDLIILDIILPDGVNGFDVLEKIKKNPVSSKIPVLVLTNLEGEEKTALEIGADDYIIKTNTSLDKLLTKIKLILKI